MLPEESKRGKVLIAIEGPDYTGKSTAIEHATSRLRQSKYSINGIKSFSRPGGTLACDSLRRIITNANDINSVTRQAVAYAEEVLFSNTLNCRDASIILFDRYNPISGQIYGPPNFREAWRKAVTERIVLVPDCVIIIESTKENILKRAALRSKRDTMDNIFAAKISKYLNRYSALKEDTWLYDNCNPCFIENNDDNLDGLVDKIYSRIKETIDERIGDY